MEKSVARCLFAVAGSVLPGSVLVGSALAGSMLAGSIQAQESPLHGTYRGRVPHVDAFSRPCQKPYKR